MEATFSSSNASSNNYGVNAIAFYDGASNSTNYGVYGQANFGANSYGVYGYAYQATKNNYGVYGTVNPASGSNNYAIYGSNFSLTTGNWAGYFVGLAYCSKGIWSPSDSMLKTNLQVIKNPVNKLSNLKPYTFTFNLAAYPSMGLPSGTHYGFLAQNVENAFPNLVTSAVQPAVLDSAGETRTLAVTFKTVNYTEFTAILTRAIQQQQQSIDSLRSRPTVGLTDNVTTNYIPMATGANAFGNSPITVSGGNVGIDFPSPETLLEMRDIVNTGSNFNPSSDGSNSGNGLQIDDANSWRVFLGSPGRYLAQKLILLYPGFS